ncbi:hypothetical protein HPB47_028498, partial [Ixodes persulcatus]
MKRPAVLVLSLWLTICCSSSESAQGTNVTEEATSRNVATPSGSRAKQISTPSLSGEGLAADSAPEPVRLTSPRVDDVGAATAARPVAAQARLARQGTAEAPTEAQARFQTPPARETETSVLPGHPMALLEVNLA